MSTTPRRPSPAPAARRTGGHLLAAVAAAAALAAAPAACADERVTGAPPAAPPAFVAPSPGDRDAGRTDPPRAHAGPAPGGAEWMGALHNEGLGVILAGARATPAEETASAESRCAFVVTAAAAFLERAARGGRIPGPVLASAPDDLSAYAGKYACAGVGGAGRVGLAAELRAAAAEGRLSGDVSPDALALVGTIDQEIDAMASAAGLSVALVPVEQAAAGLPIDEERALIQYAASVARASAYNVEAVCGSGSCWQQPPEGPPPYQMGASRPGTPPTGATRAAGVEWRAEHINATVVKADTWGCLAGAARGWSGGPTGIAVGCLSGGLLASGSVIWNYLM